MENIDTFMAVSGCEDPQVAQSFLEMAGGDLETAVSLFYEHGPGVAGGTGGSSSNTGANSNDLGDDIAFAQRLQEESYAEQPRAPDQAVHERLVDDVGVFPGVFGGIGGSFNPLRSVDQLIYGNASTGVFNQHDDSSDEELDEHQRRLANLFKPPFDIMEKADLDTAKIKATREKKWILINIQDPSIFQCQMLNRDFWKSATIKEVVRENFVFVQYQRDSVSGEQYCNFYPIADVPHIAILDPITGERVKQWTRNIPPVSKWCEQVYDFLNGFTVDKAAVNPIVKHEPIIDPNTLSEEKQLEYAIKQSLGNTDDDGDHEDDIIVLDSDDEVRPGNASDPIEIDDDDGVNAHPQPKELTPALKLQAIPAVDHPEPTTPTTTRIQIRMGDGSRVVKKFDSEDQVRVIYEVVKYQFADKVGTHFFTLTSQRENLFDKLNETIADAGLKNASILLDVEEEDEYDD